MQQANINVICKPIGCITTHHDIEILLCSARSVQSQTCVSFLIARGLAKHKDGVVHFRLWRMSPCANFLYICVCKRSNSRCNRCSDTFGVQCSGGSGAMASRHLVSTYRCCLAHTAVHDSVGKRNITSNTSVARVIICISERPWSARAAVHTCAQTTHHMSSAHAYVMVACSHMVTCMTHGHMLCSFFTSSHSSQHMSGFKYVTSLIIHPTHHFMDVS